MSYHRVYAMKFAKIYPLYVNKAEKKGRTEDEVREIISWLTGYDTNGLQAEIDAETTMEDLIKNAPCLNPSRDLIKGVVCGVRVENVEEPLMRELRYMDKLIDELARGKAMAKILRTA